MATYNGERYLQEQLDSIARQTLQPLELVITDDGSTDATLEILESFAPNVPFAVRIFRNQTRLGYADNFLKAASLCHGDLIAFCDQDDIWMQQKLSVCAGFFDDPEVLLAAHSALTVLDSGKRGRRFPRFATTRVSGLAASNPFAFVHGFAIVIRRKLLDIASTSSRPEKLLGHDQWCWFLAASAGKIATVRDVLALYRQHQNNLFGVRQATVSGQTKGVIQTLTYDATANSELACSQILWNAAKQSSDRAERLKETAKRLEVRARLHRIRTRIYSKDSGLLQRLEAFMRIFLLAGYLPDQSRTRLGPRAGIKDVFYGVTGAYQLFVPTPETSKET